MLVCGLVKLWRACSPVPPCSEHVRCGDRASTEGPSGRKVSAHIRVFPRAVTAISTIAINQTAPHHPEENLWYVHIKIVEILTNVTLIEWKLKFERGEFKTPQTKITLKNLQH